MDDPPDRTGEQKDQNRVSRPNEAGKIAEPTNQAKSRHNSAKLDKKSRDLLHDDPPNPKKKPSTQDSDKILPHQLVRVSDCKKTSKRGDSKSHRRERKRYEELIIDGLTINAFRTWEDLQDEINERISADRILRNSNLSGSHCSISNVDCNTSFSNNLDQTAPSPKNLPDLTPIPNSAAVQATIDTPPVAIIRSEKIEGRATLTESAKFQDEQSTKYDKETNSGDQELTKALRAKEAAEQHLMVLQEKLRQERKRKRHREDQRHRERQCNDVHGCYRQAGKDDLTDRGSANRSSVNLINSTASSMVQDVDLNVRKPLSGIESHLTSNQFRHGHQIEHGHLQQSSFRSPFQDPNHQQRAAVINRDIPMAPTAIHYQRASAAPPAPPLSSQMDLFEQYLNSQVYQQSRDSQHPTAYAHATTMNHSYVPSLIPPPPHTSMMAQSTLQSPYTITDTIISRQTSIIPPSIGMNQFHGGRYGPYPHLSAPDHIPMGLIGQTSGYMPSPTERSFMEFARSYANANNISNYMSSPPSSSSAHGALGLGSASNFERFAMNQRIAASGYNSMPQHAAGPMNRYASPNYNFDTRSAINASSFYPMHLHR